MIDQEQDIVDARDVDFLWCSNKMLREKLKETEQKLKDTQKSGEICFGITKNKSYIYIKFI